MSWVRIVATAAMGLILSGCGSGDSTVAKTPEGTRPLPAPGPSVAATATGSSTPKADPCAVNLGAPEIAKAVSDLPRDPRSQQPWNPEPLAGNYNQCTQLSAVIVRANTNAEHPNTRAVLFHQGQYLTQGVPDTYGFSGIDLSQCTDDVVALQAPSGITGVTGVVKFHWTGTGVELISNTG